MTNKRTRRTRVVRQLVCEEDHTPYNIGTRQKPNWVEARAVHNMMKLEECDWAEAISILKVRLVERGIKADMKREITLE